MKKNLLVLTLALLAGITSAKASIHLGNNSIKMEAPSDSMRLAELDQYWKELSRTVLEGDFEGYKAAYHEDAVIIFATGKNKVSVPITKALANWKQGFVDTKAG